MNWHKKTYRLLANPHKRQVMRKPFPFDDIIMNTDRYESKLVQGTCTKGDDNQHPLPAGSNSCTLADDWQLNIATNALSEHCQTPGIMRSHTDSYQLHNSLKTRHNVLTVLCCSVQDNCSYCQISNIRAPNIQTWMFLVSSCSCLCPIHWSQMLSWEWRCSWSSADRWCSNYNWMINNFIAY